MSVWMKTFPTGAKGRQGRVRVRLKEDIPVWDFRGVFHTIQIKLDRTQIKWWLKRVFATCGSSGLPEKSVRNSLHWTHWTI